VPGLSHRPLIGVGGILPQIWASHAENFTSACQGKPCFDCSGGPQHAAICAKPRSLPVASPRPITDLSTPEETSTCESSNRESSRAPQAKRYRGFESTSLHTSACPIGDFRRIVRKDAHTRRVLAFVGDQRTGANCGSRPRSHKLIRRRFPWSPSGPACARDLR
jgi:hypothetical protein